MPDKTATPHEIPFSLQGDKPPNLEAITKPIAERVHERLDDISPSQITGGTAGQLLVVQDTGAAAFKALSGDVTVDKAGVAAIGAAKVATAMLQDKAVSTTKINDAAVTPGKIADTLKPSGGATAGTEALRALGTSASTAAAGDDARMVYLGSSCRVYRTANQAVESGKVGVLVNFTSELWDSNGFHDETNPSRLTAPVDGFYYIQGHLQMTGNTTGSRVLQLIKNAFPGGSITVDKIISELQVEGTPKEIEGNEGGNALEVSGMARLKAGEYVQLAIFQNSGSTLQVLAGDAFHIPELGMAWIGPYPT